MVRGMDSAACPTTVTDHPTGRIGLRTNADTNTQHMKNGLKKFIPVLMALAVISGGFGAIAAAAPGSIDTTPTDSDTTIYMEDGKTLETNYTANGSVAYALPVLNATGAGADDLAMNVTHDGVEYYSYSGEWDSYASGESDTSTDYIHNVSADELNRVPMTVNENVTLTVNYWNTSAENPSPTNITVYVENSDERSVHRATENASFADVETLEAPFTSPLEDDYTAATFDSENVEVNGSETDIIYTLSDSEVQGPFGNMTEDLEDTGAFSLMMADVDAESEGPIPVFYKSSPDWYEPEDMGTYAVYSPSDDLITVHTEDPEFEDASSADVSVSSDVYRVFDVGTVWDLAGGTDGEGVSAIMDMVM